MLTVHGNLLHSNFVIHVLAWFKKPFELSNSQVILTHCLTTELKWF